MDIAARGYANPELLWSPDTLRERQSQSGLAIIDIRKIVIKGQQTADNVTPLESRI